MCEVTARFKAEGRMEGKTEERKSIIKSMLLKGCSVDMIENLTESTKSLIL